MEHPCNQCGAIVEDGTPFCRQCRAPQIRVAGQERAPKSVSSEVEELHFPSVGSTLPLAPFPVLQWPRALRAAAAAGLVAAVLMFTPIGVLGLGMLAGGFLAVAFYKRNNFGLPPTPATGAKLGLLTGAIGFAFFAVFLAIQIAIFHKGGELRAALIHAVEQAAARSTDPEAQAVASWLKSPEGLSLMIVLSLIFTLIAFMVLSGIGGALGTVILRDKRKNY